jgi:N-hydroxyarylamine O-acetyltransferase
MLVPSLFMDIEAYLQRVDYNKQPRVDESTLRDLQLAHLLTVPFENLDTGLKRPIQLDTQSLWNKIIVNKRGGFCYELNGMFAWLLKAIGFDVTYLEARDIHDDGTFSPEFDHLTLMVQIPNQATRWLADVGWGDTFTQPLDIDSIAEQQQGLRAYKLERLADRYLLWQRNYNGTWERQYSFTLDPHRFPDEYQETCLYHQTSPQSIFTQNQIITRLTRDGRISLDNKNLIVTRNGVREKRPINGDDEYNALLKEHFGISL